MYKELVERLMMQSRSNSKAALVFKPTCFNYNRGWCRECTCDKCNQSGYISVSKNPPMSKPCDCVRKVYNARKLEKCGLTELAERSTFDLFTTSANWQKIVKNKAMQFARSEYKSHWFYIGGQSGSGKSHICVAIANEILAKEGNLNFFRWVDDGAVLKAKVNNESFAKEVEKILEESILYIDDFLKIEPTEADRRIAFSLINGAYNKKKTVIISSERSLDEVCQWDNAIGGRIKERCGEWFITLVGKEKNLRFMGD